MNPEVEPRSSPPSPLPHSWWVISNQAGAETPRWPQVAGDLAGWLYCSLSWR